MGKKEIVLVVVLIVVSLVVGVLLGRVRDVSDKEDISIPSSSYEDRGGSEAQYPVGQMPAAQDATAVIQRILKERPNDAKAFAQVGDIYFDQHKFNDAIEHYKKAIALEPQDVDSYNDLGLSYHYTGRSDEGLKYVEEGIQKNPNYQRAWLTKGFILAIKGNIPEARNAWEKAYKIDPNSDVGKSSASFLAQYQVSPK